MGKVELKSISAEGIDTEDKLDPDAKVRYIDNPRFIGLEAAATYRGSPNSYKRDLKRFGSNPNNPTCSLLLKVKLLYKMRINQTLRGAGVQ